MGEPPGYSVRVAWREKLEAWSEMFKRLAVCYSMTAQLSRWVRPCLRLAAGEVTLTGDGRGLRKTGQGRDDPLRALLICAGAAQPRAAPVAGVVHVQPPAW